MTSLADLWHTTITTALALDPDDCWRTIMGTANNGLRATGYEARVRCSAGDTVVERLAIATAIDDDEKPYRWWPSIVGLSPAESRDLHAVNRESCRFVDSVAALNAECRDAGSPDTWHEAVVDGNLLDQLGLIAAAADLDRSVGGWVRRGALAVARLEGVHERHCAHPPSNDQALREERCCLSHARIGDYTRPRCGDLAVCKTCRDWIDVVTRVTEVHRDPNWWPSEELLRAHADWEITGRRIAMHEERAMWVARKGGPRRDASCTDACQA